jgi:NAD(P)-dependent dehydrogenase (short-subunit alcohol dehydrogenase family)
MGLKRINFDDLQGERSYAPWRANCQSKLADLMFTLELGRLCASAGFRLLSNAVHPGYARTNLQTIGPGRPLYAEVKRLRQSAIKVVKRLENTRWSS